MSKNAPMSYLAEKTKLDPYRHAGVPSNECHCGLVHDDELTSDTEKRDKVIDLLGAKCANSNCRYLNEDGTLGCKNRLALQIDHVYDDGCLDRRTLKQSVAYWTRVLRDVLSGSDRYQILCANCNWLKRYANGSPWNEKFSRLGGYRATR